MSNLANILHDFRVFPRLTLVGYMATLWGSIEWFKGIPNPTGEQVAFMASIIGLAGVIFGFYTKTTSGTEK